MSIFDDDWDNDYCYECTGYGDDYSYGEDGELICNCVTCPCNPNRDEDEQNYIIHSL